MSNYICNIRCSHRQPSGYCGITGGYETCQYRLLHHEENTVVGYVPPLKRTNADRIRSMTDEELADFLCDIGECDRRCPAKVGDCIFSDSTCRTAWLDWLKQEAE